MTSHLSPDPRPSLRSMDLPPGQPSYQSEEESWSVISRREQEEESYGGLKCLD